MLGIWVTFVILALLLLLATGSEPWFTRPNILFGVAFDVKDLRQDGTARNLKQQYARWCSILAVVVWGSAAVCARVDHTELAVTVAMMAAMVLYLGAAFGLQVFFHRQSLAYHDRLTLPVATSKVVVDLAVLASQKVLAPTWGLALLPLIVVAYGLQVPAVSLAATAAVAFVVGFTFIFSRFSAASVKGSAQAASGVAQGRNAVLAYALADAVLTQTFIIVTAKMPQWTQRLVWIYAGLTLGGLLLVIFYWLKQSRAKPLKGPIVDDNAHWLFGSIYYNPADPTVFVEKRLGIGVTLNMARPGAWWFLVGTFAVVGVILVIAFSMG